MSFTTFSPKHLGFPHGIFDKSMPVCSTLLMFSSDRRSWHAGHGSHKWHSVRNVREATFVLNPDDVHPPVEHISGADLRPLQGSKAPSKREDVCNPPSQSTKEHR